MTMICGRIVLAIVNSMNSSQRGPNKPTAFSVPDLATTAIPTLTSARALLTKLNYMLSLLLASHYKQNGQRTRQR
jgi:hypothetical protein